ncbi:hypothetical protein J437_LFUL001309 [Ladona fulva]|uniref:Inter-alpha-trypsin inhibitor heavy chain H4 n=1 Tax=Ladona fulva TaxID=123851 RepID=A0A8K0JYV9_LADFU|nr:hypothetical protein J437_LFUL001309 [Ladona fulva]
MTRDSPPPLMKARHPPAHEPFADTSSRGHPQELSSEAMDKLLVALVIFTAVATSALPTETPEPATEGTTLPSTTDEVTLAAVVSPDEEPDDLTDVPEASSPDSSGPEVYSLHVKSDIKYRYATTLVTSRVVNRGSKAAEASFQFVLPENAFVSGFLIEVKGKVYKAYVKEKEEANKEYQEAVAHGQTAAQVAVSARDSNLFAVSVNLEPRSKMTFNLTYEELLTRRLGLYDHMIHLVTSDKVIHDMKVEVSIEENQNITTVKVPEPTTENEVGDAVADGLVVVSRPSPTSALIVYAPSKEQQKKLLSKKNKDNTLTPFSEEENNTQRLRVQYDVDHHSASGDLLLRDGYFVHFFAPTEEPSKKLHKHVIFVLDTSGSMWGRKIQQLQEAMLLILDSLNEDGDYFSLVQFSDSVKVWTPLNRENEQSQGIHLVTSQNIDKAKKYIKSMEALGGTNINLALRSGLQIAALGLSGEPFRRTLEQKYGGHLPQPLVIFLTDGEPTTGETRLSKILAATRAMNSEARAPIFSLAFGNDADFRFVKKLSLQNHGFARRIYEAADATLQLESFFQEVSSPLLNNVTFSYVNPKVDQSSLTESSFHTYFAGTEVVIAGRVNDLSITPDELGGVVSSSSSSASMSVSSESEGEPAAVTNTNSPTPSFLPPVDSSVIKGTPVLIDDIIIPKFPPPRTPEPEIRKPEKGSLERLWAFLTIRQLLDQNLAMEEERDPWEPTTTPAPIESIINSSILKPPTPSLTPKQKALKLALQYGFVTPLTSLVVVKPPEKGSESSKPSDSTLTDSMSGKENSVTDVKNKIVPVLSIASGRPRPGLAFAMAGPPAFPGMPQLQSPIAASGFIGRPGVPGAPGGHGGHYFPTSTTSFRPLYTQSESFDQEAEEESHVDGRVPLTLANIQWYPDLISAQNELNITQDGDNGTLYAVDTNQVWQRFRESLNVHDIINEVERKISFCDVKSLTR